METPSQLAALPGKCFLQVYVLQCRVQKLLYRLADNSKSDTLSSRLKIMRPMHQRDSHWT